MAKKQISFDFYQLVISSINNTSLTEFFECVKNGLTDSFVEVKGYTRELYRLDKNKKGFWVGQFRKYRVDQLPAFARFGEDETEIKLDEDQGIIERNCFIFYPDRNVLVWQHDAHANYPERFADFLSTISGGKVEAVPILTKSALLRLMNNKTEALKFHISVARPTAPSMYNENKFTANLFSLMNNSGADLFNLTGGIDLRSKDAGFLNSGILKHGLETLVTSGAARTAKVLVLEEGKRELLDLITDRIKASRQVESDKKSIPFITMIDMLESAYDEKREVLDEILGTTHAALA
ncbi:DUF6731 family protein [Acinetobacter indicus]|uniref:DUF6731 family protein n=1 Tax=Acinetobacter indicus TaxID=756892 RepID=UPI002575A777|nr:DUF6731 family protein [Acinetobacter indicus]MDM1272636.1 hypothetical protein [Acinetobacter indicus]